MEMGGSLFERAGFFNLARTMVSVLHKELECKVQKLKYKKLVVIHLKINSPLVNKPSRISPHKVLQSWMINTVYHLVAKNN